MRRENSTSEEQLRGVEIALDHEERGHGVVILPDELPGESIRMVFRSILLDRGARWRI